ncbi:MAG: flagellar protein FlaG, partial [Herbaspirillum sp.]
SAAPKPTFTSGSAATTVQTVTPAPTKVAAEPIARAVPPPSMAQLSQAVGELNKSMKSSASGVEFSIDTDSNRTVVKVVDQQTKEIIRQMPSVEALEISKALDHMQGLLINHKV